MATYNLDKQADIAAFHSFVGGYARDNAAYTESGTAEELLAKMVNDASQISNLTEAQAFEVPAHQVADARKAFLFAAAGFEHDAE